MPAKKIKVIALDTPAAEESAAEAPTEAQGMDEVMNNIQTENTSLEETTAEVPVPQEPAAKAAAKRKPRATENRLRLRALSATRKSTTSTTSSNT